MCQKPPGKKHYEDIELTIDAQPVIINGRVLSYDSGEMLIWDNNALKTYLINVDFPAQSVLLKQRINDVYQLFPNGARGYIERSRTNQFIGLLSIAIPNVVALSLEDKTTRAFIGGLSTSIGIYFFAQGNKNLKLAGYCINPKIYK